MDNNQAGLMFLKLALNWAEDHNDDEVITYLKIAINLLEVNND